MKALTAGFAIAVLSLTLSACNGDGGSGVTPEPTIPSTPEIESLDGFLAFAAQLDRALDQGNTTFISNRVLKTQLTCSGDEQLGPCLGESADTVLEGVYSGTWRTDNVELLPESQLAESYQELLDTAKPEEEDDYGSGEPRLYAVATAPAGPIGGRDTFYAIITAITGDGETTQRQALLYGFVSWNGLFRAFGEVRTGELGDEWLSGECVDCYTDWHLWEGATSEDPTSPKATATPE